MNDAKLNDEYEGLDPFDIEVQFALYIKRMYRGKGLKEMPSEQLKQLQQSFYAAWGQCLHVQREFLSEIEDEEEAVEKLESMWQQVGKFWTEKSRGHN